MTSTAISKYLSQLGRKGGLSKSDAKRRAVRANLAKARQVKSAARTAGQSSPKGQEK